MRGHIAPYDPVRLLRPSRFTYTRIYCTPDKETHFENVTVELSRMVFAPPPAAPVHIGGNRPVSSAFLFGADARWGAHDSENRLNHPTPAPQFATVLSGVFSLTTTDEGLWLPMSASADYTGPYPFRELP